MNTSNPTLRTIHVAVGSRARAHLGPMAADPRFAPVAGVEVVPDFVDFAVETYGLPREHCFGTLGEALRAVEADAVVIATPVVFHGDQIEEALAAGKHVMVEKPFTIDLAQAQRIVRTAEQRGLKVMVTQNMRYIPALHTMARLVREQVYGAPGYFNLVFHKYRPTPYNDSPHQQLWQMSVHELDVIRSVIPGEPVRVTCREMSPPWTAYPTAPGALAMLEYENGVTGVYMGSSDSKSTNFIMRVDCADGALINPAYQGKLFHALGREPQTELPLDTLPGGLGHDPLMSHLFYEYVVHGHEPPISGRHNLGTMRLVDACIRSAQTHETVELPRLQPAC